MTDGGSEDRPIRCPVSLVTDQVRAAVSAIPRTAINVHAKPRRVTFIIDRTLVIAWLSTSKAPSAVTAPLRLGLQLEDRRCATAVARPERDLTAPLAGELARDRQP